METVHQVCIRPSPGCKKAIASLLVLVMDRLFSVCQTARTWDGTER